jgi:hypothetical protein
MTHGLSSQPYNNYIVPDGWNARFKGSPDELSLMPLSVRNHEFKGSGSHSSRFPGKEDIGFMAEEANN